MQMTSGELWCSSLKQLQGRAMLGDQENFFFTGQKAIDWLIIYSFFYVKFSAVWGISL